MFNMTHTKLSRRRMLAALLGGTSIFLGARDSPQELPTFQDDSGIVHIECPRDILARRTPVVDKDPALEEVVSSFIDFF